MIIDIWVSSIMYAHLWEGVGVGHSPTTPPLSPPPHPVDGRDSDRVASAGIGP